MPRRRCAGCGRVAPKPDLVRLALDGGGRGGRVVLDRTGTMPGRGAYLCRAADGRGDATPAPPCLAAATRRGGLNRALRAAVAVPLEFVESTST